MILYNGKNKDMTKEAIAKEWYLILTLKLRPIEPLEAVDFSPN